MHYSYSSMGIRRLFSRGGQNFPGGGAKTYYLPKKTLKKTPKNILFFSKKSQKHTILAGQGGSRAPSCPPLGTPMYSSMQFGYLA